ncbi:hypothetical protein LBMAG48_24000 [Phycisphaerae bacterium]|nr:hypothetical protein LBMAG48_24000 [Phycisphaerae bacterium]
MANLPKRVDQFARMREARDSTLDSREKLVLIMWVTFADGNDGTAWPSIARLAKATSLGESTVRESVRELERLGWLVLVGSRKGGRMSNRYRFQVPNPPDGGGLNPTPSGPQPDTPQRPTRQSVAPSPPQSVAEQTNQQNKEQTTQHTAAVAALLSLGVGKDWLAHPHATPERLAWLLSEAKGKQSPAGFVVAAIRDAYSVPAPDEAREKAIDGAVRKAFDPFDGLDEGERASWIVHARRKYPNLANASTYPDDAAVIRGAVTKLMRAGDVPPPKRAMGID